MKQYYAVKVLNLKSGQFVELWKQVNPTRASVQAQLKKEGKSWKEWDYQRMAFVPVPASN